MTGLQMTGLQMTGLQMTGLQMTGLQIVETDADERAMAEIIETIADLKRDLERIERKLDYLFRKMDIEYVESDLPSFMLEATQLIRHGRRDEAMRLIREYTAVGLYEAKEQVEQIERNLGLVR